MIFLKEIKKFDSFEMLSSQIVEGSSIGIHRSPFHGFSVEFSEHKAYSEGDSQKFVDWKVYGKTEKMFIKKYDEETNLRCHLILDCSSSMYMPKFQDVKNEYPQNKMGFVCLISAIINNLLSKQKDALGLTLFDDKIFCSMEAKTKFTHVKKIYDELENVLYKKDLGNKTDISKQLNFVATDLPKRSLVIIFSDFLVDNIDETFQAIQHLKYKKHQILIFHIMDFEKEVLLNFSDNFCKFIDVETNNEIKINIQDYKELFKKKQEEFMKMVKIKCNDLHIEYNLININENIEIPIQKFLIKRSRML